MEALDRNEGPGLETRRALALAAFQRTCRYDYAISPTPAARGGQGDHAVHR